MKVKKNIKAFVILFDIIMMSMISIQVKAIKNLSTNTGTTTEFIKTDQFGYRPNDEKIALVSDPQTGYNSDVSFTPGTTYQVRDWNTDSVVYTGSPVAWNGGITQTQSGDKVWWFDFSSLTTEGEYYIFDPTNNVGSYKFKINPCIYNEVLKQSLRMFYYQRCGCPKTLACAGNGWADAACHIGTLQDTDCRLYNDSSSSTSRNLSGGWHDAGDYNKYVNFTFSTLKDLLLAYKENPIAFGDDNNIPESGNGIPDILDEVKYELDWLLKMQQNDGSVLSVIGGGSASPPSKDTNQRKYGPANTSATLTCAALFALASKEYLAVGQNTYAATLLTAAINAWTWASIHPVITFYNSGLLAAGENETDSTGLFTRRLSAAIYLYDITRDNTYKTYIENNYSYSHLISWGYVYPFENEMQDALLFYASLNGITPGVGANIKNTYINSVVSGNTDNLPAYTNQTDAYRAWMKDDNYTWGSNKTKACQANILLNMNVYNLDSANAKNYINSALGYINYFHGVNPNSKVYLSNMNSFGAGNSVTKFYHSWFAHGSALWDQVGVSTYGPPPGFVPGGPNPSYSLDGCCPSGCGSTSNNALCLTDVTPPLNQPIQKSYKDFNDSWPVDSWTVTEPAIYTNASYVRMLSKFCGTAACLSTGIPSSNYILNTEIFPNPFSKEFEIKFPSEETGQFKVQIIDITGKIIFEEQIKTIGNEITTIIPGNMKSVLYIIEISGNSKIVRKKLIREQLNQ
jgi:hypothetical protein